MRKIKTNFVSELDQFLKKFDEEHPELSKSQQAEIKKHQRVAKLRDDENREEDDKAIWSGF
jgi:hypothetical protein